MVKGFRRAAIIAIVVSLAIAALLGIIALLGGEFGELQARVLVTTLTVAAFGTTALCHLAVIARDVRVLGFLGIAASVVAAFSALLLIWGDLEWQAADPWWKALFVGLVLALSFAQANLLLLLQQRPQQVIRVALWVTLVAIGVIAAMIILPILTDGHVPGDEYGETYWRLFGVVAIVDALGTIVLPILGLVLRRAAAPDAPVAAAPAAGALALTVPEALADRIRARAAETGQTPEHVALTALDAALDPPL